MQTSEYDNPNMDNPHKILSSTEAKAWETGTHKIIIEG